MRFFSAALLLLLCSTWAWSKPTSLRRGSPWENDSAGGNPSAGITFAKKGDRFTFWYRACVYLDQECPDGQEYKTKSAKGRFRSLKSGALELSFDRALESTRFKAKRVFVLNSSPSGWSNEELGTFSVPVDPSNDESS